MFFVTAITKRIAYFGVFFASLAAFLALSVEPSFAAGATLNLNPSTVATSVGQTFTVTINLDTGGANTDGTRAVVLYDKDFLDVSKVTPGTIYGQYPQNAQVTDPATGTIKISGIANTDTTYSGSGQFASIDFTAKAQGTANIKFDFTPGSTTDSNVADNATQTDILAQTNSATVTIAAGAVGASPSPVGATTQPGATQQPQPTQLPNTANINPTLTLSAVGAILVALGATLFLAL